MKIKIGPLYSIPGKNFRIPRKLKKRLRTDPAFAIKAAVSTVIGAVDLAKKHSISRLQPDFKPGGITVKDSQFPTEEFILNSKVLEASGIMPELITVVKTNKG